MWNSFLFLFLIRTYAPMYVCKEFFFKCVFCI